MWQTDVLRKVIEMNDSILVHRVYGPASTAVYLM